MVQKFKIKEEEFHRFDKLCQEIGLTRFWVLESLSTCDHPDDEAELASDLESEISKDTNPIYRRFVDNYIAKIIAQILIQMAREDDKVDFDFVTENYLMEGVITFAEQYAYEHFISRCYKILECVEKDT